MNTIILTLSAIFSLLLLLPNHVFAANADGVITEKDLKGYKKTADFELPKEKRGSASLASQKKSLKTDQSRDQQYYCKKGTECRRRIEEAQEDLEKARMKLDKLKGSLNIKQARLTGAEENVERKQRELARAENDLRDLENEAHRKGLPSGWVRCQF